MQVRLQLVLSTVIFLTLLALTPGPVAAAGANADKWWDPAWSMRTPVTVVEKSGQDLRDYQVVVSVSYAADMRPGFEDVRFVSNDGMADLPFWHTKSTTSSTAAFWVKVPFIPANGETTFYLYYGNPEAKDGSNIHSTFIWGDDFDDPSWTMARIHQQNYGEATQYIENGEYHQSGGPFGLPIAEIYDSGSGALKPFPSDFVAEVDVKPVLLAGSALIASRYNGVTDSYQQAIDFRNNGVGFNKVTENVWTNLSWNQVGTPFAAGQWYSTKSTVVRYKDPNSLILDINDTFYCISNDLDVNCQSLGFESFGYTDSFHVAYDNFRVRQFAHIEPLVVIGKRSQLGVEN